MYVLCLEEKEREELGGEREREHLRGWIIETLIQSEGYMWTL
jgi:hypothetical protein